VLSCGEAMVRGPLQQHLMADALQMGESNALVFLHMRACVAAASARQLPKLLHKDHCLLWAAASAQIPGVDEVWRIECASG